MFYYNKIDYTSEIKILKTHLKNLIRLLCLSIYCISLCKIKSNQFFKLEEKYDELNVLIDEPNF